MDAISARHLLKFVNQPENIEDLVFYLDRREAQLKNSLVTAADIRSITKIQGAIEEIRRMKSIQEEVRAKARESNG